MGVYATDVIIRRGMEGPQLVLSWTNSDDAGLTAVQIRRGTNGYPESITDGIQVYLDSSPVVSGDDSYADVAVSGQVTYYYTIFTQVTGVWYHKFSTQKREFPLDGRDFHLRLWESLPAIYRKQDETTNQQTLTTQMVDDEWWNYWEDQLKQYGQLYRFLKIFGIQFGGIRELIKYFTVFYDVYNVRDDLLPYLANLIGAKILRGVSLQRQRFLIANAVELFKIRGTIAGIERFAEGNFQTEVLIQEFAYDILESNRVDRTSVADDDIVLNNWNSPWNTIDYVVDGRQGEQWSYRTIGLYFDDCLDTDITQDMLDLAEEFFSDFLPGTGAWYAFTHWDSLWSDEFVNFSNWTETDPSSSLNVVSEQAVFLVANGAGPATSSLNRAPGITGANEFALDLPLMDLIWPTTVTGSDAYVEIRASWGIHYVAIRLSLMTTGENRYSVIYSNSGGSGTVDLDLSSAPDTARLRLERGPNGLIRGLGDVDEIRTIVHQLIHSDYTSAPTDVKLEWSVGTNSGNFQAKSDWFKQWEALAGATWVQVYP